MVERDIATEPVKLEDDEFRQFELAALRRELVQAKADAAKARYDLELSQLRGLRLEAERDERALIQSIEERVNLSIPNAVVDARARTIAPAPRTVMAPEGASDGVANSTDS